MKENEIDGWKILYSNKITTLRPAPPQKSISAQEHSNGLKFGAYVGAVARRLW
jgi:hypothetical protein